MAEPPHPDKTAAELAADVAALEQELLAPVVLTSMLTAAAKVPPATSAPATNPAGQMTSPRPRKTVARPKKPRASAEGTAAAAAAADDGAAEEGAAAAAWTTRCLCGDTRSEGTMVQCERCEVWQHAHCMGMATAADIPVRYFCELCEPRAAVVACGCGDAAASAAKGPLVRCVRCGTFQHSACVGVYLRPFPSPGDTRPRQRPYICARCKAKDPSSSSSSSSAAATDPAKESPRLKKQPKQQQQQQQHLPRTHQAGTQTAQPGSPAAAKAKKKGAGAGQSEKPFEFVEPRELRRELKADFTALGRRPPRAGRQPARHSLGPGTLSAQEAAMLQRWAVVLAGPRVGSEPGQREGLARAIGLLLDSSELAVLELLAAQIDAEKHQTAPIAEEAQACEEITESTYPPPEEGVCVLASELRAAGVDVLPDPGAPVAASALNTIGGTGVWAAEPLLAGAFIAEFAGRLVAPHVAEHEWVAAKGRILLYSGSLPAPQAAAAAAAAATTQPPRTASAVAVDTRACGGCLRFIHRSCSPTAVVRAYEPPNRDGRVALGIFALPGGEGVAPGTELTIAFDAPFQALTNPLAKCPCGRTAQNCPVAAWAAEHTAGFDKLAELLPALLEKVRAEYAPLSPRPNEASAAGAAAAAAAADGSASPRKKRSIVTQLESSLEWGSTPKNKMSREERKLLAVMHTFEKIERREERKKRAVGEMRSPAGDSEYFEDESPRGKLPKTEKEPAASPRRPKRRPAVPAAPSEDVEMKDDFVDEPAPVTAVAASAIKSEPTAKTTATISTAPGQVPAAAVPPSPSALRAVLPPKFVMKKAWMDQFQRTQQSPAPPQETSPALTTTPPVPAAAAAAAVPMVPATGAPKPL